MTSRRQLAAVISTRDPFSVTTLLLAVLCPFVTGFSTSFDKTVSQRQQQLSRLFSTPTDTAGVSSSSSSSSARFHSVNQQELDTIAGNDYPRTYVPLASTFELNPNRPNEVFFLGQSYVIYAQTFDNTTLQASDWVVVDNACPHRLAPLSEGRIERQATSNTNNGATPPTTLECSYHGWAFDGQGRCVRIPQANDEQQFQAAISNTKQSCHVQSYPVVVCKNVLWAWLWPQDPIQVALDPAKNENTTSSSNENLPLYRPEAFLKGVMDNCSTYTRDLPYGWDTLLENIVDPAHVPWVR